MSFRIQFTSGARQDLRDIFEYIAFEFTCAGYSKSTDKRL